MWLFEYENNAENRVKMNVIILVVVAYETLAKFLRVKMIKACPYRACCFLPDQ